MTRMLILWSIQKLYYNHKGQISYLIFLSWLLKTLPRCRGFAIRFPHDLADIGSRQGYEGCSLATLAQLKTLKQLFQTEFITIGASSNEYNIFLLKSMVLSSESLQHVVVLAQMDFTKKSGRSAWRPKRETTSLHIKSLWFKIFRIKRFLYSFVTTTNGYCHLRSLGVRLKTE